MTHALLLAVAAGTLLGNLAQAADPVAPAYPGPNTAGEPLGSDGYATGLAVVILRRSLIEPSDERIARGIARHRPNLPT